MNSINFTKMCGAGNDFIFIDSSDLDVSEMTPPVIRKLCDRRFGIGADGVIVFEKKVNPDFAMNYFNADGSTGSLCANGARCAIFYNFVNYNASNDTVSFFSNGIEYSGSVIDDNLVKFNLNSPTRIKYNFKIKAGGQLINSCFADTGSPHVVIDIGDVLVDFKQPNKFYSTLENFPVETLGREIRYLKEFELGTNVNFIKIIDGKVYIRTYERGVENETLACGTGAVASALVAFSQYKLIPPITLKTWGGDELFVNFEIENQRVKNLSLTGPAMIVFKGNLLNSFFSN